MARVSEAVYAQRRRMVYPIGTQYWTRGKAPRLCTVVDIHTTRDSSGEVVKRRYVATHLFMGQVITDYDVIDTTIAMGNVTHG